MKNEFGSVGIAGKLGMFSIKVLANLYYPYAKRQGSIAKLIWIDTWTGDCKNIYSFANICVLFIPLKSPKICVR